MNKEEILGKSRKENRNRDVFEVEVAAQAQRIGGLIAVLAAFALICTEAVLGWGINYGYLVIMLMGGTGIWLIRALRLKRKSDILLTVLYGALAIYASVMYVLSLGL